MEAWRWPGFLRFTGLGAFFETELRVQLHERMAIATSMIVQVVLLIFVGVLAPQLLSIALVGAILFSVFALGQRVQNEAAYVRIDHKLNELYLSSPLTAPAYFLGMALGVLVAYLAPVVVLVVALELVAPLSLGAALVLLGVAVAVWVVSISIGYVASTLFRDMRAIWPYASLFYNLFGVLPPVFYPLRLFPTALRPVALAMPPSAAAALVAQARLPTTLSPPEVALAVGALLAESVALLLFALYWAHRSVRERST